MSDSPCLIPPLGNEYFALVKNSALVSLLAVHDVMHAERHRERKPSQGGLVR